VQQWVERAVEAIDVTVRVASRQVEDEDSPKARIRKAGALAAALNLDANRRALALLDEILHEDPDEPLAAALASWCYAQRVVYNWSNDFDRDKTEAKYFAASATQAGLNDAPCLTTIATARTLIGDANAAQVLLERAMYLNGRLPAARTRMGWLANYSDAPRDAIRHFRAAIKLAPTDPSLFNTLAGLGVAHFIDGDHTQAIRHMEQALALNPKAAWIYRNLVPAYTAAGDRHRAEDGVAVLLGNYPRLTAADVTDAMVFSAPVMAQISKGLREAGLAP
jgi:adenylate cyclase